MKCPECGNEDPKSMLGYEVQGVYDGVLFWVCGGCGFAFPRNHGFPYRNIKSEIYAEKYNEKERKAQ